MASSPAQPERSIRRYTTSQLKLAGDLYGRVLSGIKTSTIRYGFVFISNERLRLCSGSKAMTVRVLTVDYSKTFGSLSDEDAVRDGFLSITELRAEMRRFYPEIGNDDPVTIFQFTRVVE